MSNSSEHGTFSKNIQKIKERFFLSHIATQSTKKNAILNMSSLPAFGNLDASIHSEKYLLASLIKTIEQEVQRLSHVHYTRCAYHKAHALQEALQRVSNEKTISDYEDFITRRVNGCPSILDVTS